jgi:purine-binding chemotaxis protein CheW
VTTNHGHGNDTIPAAAGLAALAGKYMSFQLADEVYGLRILDVREIIGLMKITPMPRAPAALCGVINLRGKVIPVVDLRVRFAMPPVPATDQTVIIVVQWTEGGRSLTTGLLVDRVLEVLSFDAGRIEPTPNLGGNAADFIMGVGKAEKHIAYLLDTDRLLSPESLHRATA